MPSALETFEDLINHEGASFRLPNINLSQGIDRSQLYAMNRDLKDLINDVYSSPTNFFRSYDITLGQRENEVDQEERN